VNRLIQQYCGTGRGMSVPCERLCQFILDLIRCRDRSDDECILDRDEICDIIKFLAAS